MEFTVSKTDLVRELSLSQGVVEKKTTIPILSNVLVEAQAVTESTSTATDLELGIRSSCPARVKKPGAGTIPAKRLLGLCSAAAGCGSRGKAPGKPMGRGLVCGRSRTRIAGMSRESFPELPQMPAVSWRSFPVGVLASSLIAENHFRYLDGRIALYVKMAFFAVVEECRPGDGRDGWASAGDGGEPDRTTGSYGNVSGAAAA